MKIGMNRRPCDLDRKGKTREPVINLVLFVCTLACLQFDPILGEVQRNMDYAANMIAR